MIKTTTSGLRRFCCGGPVVSYPRHALAVAVASGLLTTGPTVYAQSTPLLEEVTVTARKREESVLEIPESVTNFSASELERANIRTLKDIGLSVPNLFMSTRMDGFPNVSIRGMGGFGNTQGVGFYLDDVQLFSDQSSRFGDLERVEVLKGPQGVLYGGSNIGGAVKFVSTRPSTEALEGKIQASVGEFGFQDIEGQINVPLSDSWAARVFAFDESSDGFLQNPNSTRSNGLTNDNDPDVGASERRGVRLALAGDISERLSAYITARYNELDGPNNTWVRELDGNFEYPESVDTSFNPRHERDTTAFTAELNYEFDSVTATFIGSYNDTSSKRESDLDLTQEWVLDLVRPEEFEAVTAELRLSSSSDSPLQWQVGAFHLDLDRELRSVLNIRGGFCFLDPGFCDPLPPQDDDVILAVAPFEVSDRRRTQNALFASATYRFDTWEFSAGLRVDDWESERQNLDSGLSGTQGDTEVLGRLSATWFADDDSIVYASVSQGFEPGDLNLANFADDNSLLPYEAETATQYELGYKSRLFGGRAALTAAAFFIDYRDRQYELQAQDPSGGFVEGIVNVGDSTQWGIEADLTMALSEAWTLTLGGGYVDAEWDSGTISPVNEVDLGGESPPNIADLSLTASLDYEHTFNSGMVFSARLAGRYKADAATNSQFFDVPGDDFAAWGNPEFTVVDLGGSLSWDAWELRLHVENLLDEEYYVDSQEFPNFAGSALPGAPGSIIIGTREQPRRAVFSLKYLF